MSRHAPGITGVLAIVMICQWANAGSPSSGEMATTRRWVAAKFEAAQPLPKPEPGLLVLANHDPVARNARGEEPLRVADAQYTRGLYCHAASEVVVRLPGPGKTFSATVGVDSNDQTRPGRGSIVFSVSVAGKQVFRSGVMREGMAGAAAGADLGGATTWKPCAGPSPCGGAITPLNPSATRA